MRLKNKKTSEHLVIELKKCNNSSNINDNWANIYKGGMTIRIWEEREKECEMTNGKKDGFGRMEGER